MKKVADINYIGNKIVTKANRSFTLSDDFHVDAITDKIGVLYFDNRECSLTDIQASFNIVRDSGIFEYFIVLPTDNYLKTMSEEMLEAWINKTSQFLEKVRNSKKENSEKTE